MLVLLLHQIGQLNKSQSNRSISSEKRLFISLNRTLSGPFGKIDQASEFKSPEKCFRYQSNEEKSQIKILFLIIRLHFPGQKNKLMKVGDFY